MLECGLFQGRRQDTYEKNKNFGYDPKEIDALILSHAHIDHSGNIPNLVKNGFDGPIYATSATIDLCEIMLKDSAYLQQRDIEWLNKRKKSRIPENRFIQLKMLKKHYKNLFRFNTIQQQKFFQVLSLTTRMPDTSSDLQAFYLKLKKEEKKSASVFREVFVVTGNVMPSRILCLEHLPVYQ